MSTQVSAIYKNRDAANLAVDALASSGFAVSDISMLMTDGTHGREFSLEAKTKAPEGAATGGAIGGVLGAVAAGLATVATVSVPGIGLVAAGPLVGALTGAGAGAAIGGLAGGLIGLGFPEHEARLNAGEVENGGILVGVYAHADRADVAREVLKSTGGDHVHG